MTHILSIHKFNITFLCFIYNRRAIFFLKAICEDWSYQYLALECSCILYEFTLLYLSPGAKVAHSFYMNDRLLFFEVSPFFWNEIPMLKAVHTLVG